MASTRSETVLMLASRSAFVPRKNVQVAPMALKAAPPKTLTHSNNSNPCGGVSDTCNSFIASVSSGTYAAHAGGPDRAARPCRSRRTYSVSCRGLSRVVGPHHELRLIFRDADMHKIRADPNPLHVMVQ